MSTLLQTVINIAKQAGAAILEIYNSDQQLAIQTKSDQTPVTAADLKSHQIIHAALAKLEPNYPILSEEGPAIDFAKRQLWTHYWLVDPLDGTKEFIENTGEFTVNIALIVDHQPILGVIYCPIPDIVYFADAKGSFKQQAGGEVVPLQLNKTPSEPLTITISKHHQAPALQLFLQQLEAYQLILAGSAFKFGLVAEGKADLYPRFGPTSEWDSAAGQCILEHAGGKVLNFQGQALRYNTKDSLINPEFFAFGRTDLSKYVIMAKSLNIDKGHT